MGAPGENYYEIHAGMGTKMTLKDLVIPASMDGHGDKSFKTGLCQGLERLPVKKEKVTELGGAVKDDHKENPVIL